MNYVPTATAELTRMLRRNATPAERILWEHLRAYRFEGLKFRRQHSYGRYVLDFYCHELSLAVEIDGPDHSRLENHLQDIERTKYLESRGLRVVRFSNDEVLQDTAGVLEKLRLFVTAGVLPSPNPLPLRERA